MSRQSSQIKKNDWLNLSENDWESLLPLVRKDDKAGVAPANGTAIFRLFSRGVATQRDEWVYDADRSVLSIKANALVSVYESTRRDKAFADRSTIKWDRELTSYLGRRVVKVFNEKSIIQAAYRPFTKRWLYFDPHFNGMTYQLPSMFADGPNPTLVFTDPFAQKPWMALCVDSLPDLHLVGAAAAATCTSRVRYNKEGERLDNITDWALKRFADRYGKTVVISKDGIFAYVYAVLHDPVYRETYALNLKREFPRIPLYDNFERWRAWGQTLLDLHIGYEAAAPFGLIRTDVLDAKRAEGATPAVKLKSDHETGVIVLDTETQLSGVPAEVWLYRLGNRSALDWVLDQHKEKTPKDPTIRARFNTYRFADYKEAVIDLLDRVTTISVETVRITEAMRAVPRS